MLRQITGPVPKVCFLFNPLIRMWTDHTAATYMKGQSRLYLLRKLRSFGVQGDLLVASAIFYGVVCWSSSISAADRRRLDKLIKKASCILGCPLDSVQVVGESRMMLLLSDCTTSTAPNRSHSVLCNTNSIHNLFALIGILSYPFIHLLINNTLPHCSQLHCSHSTILSLYNVYESISIS